MAQQINVSITLEDGKLISPFSRLKFNQKVNEHSRFEFHFPVDVIEKEGDSIIKTSKNYIGKSVSIQLSSKDEGEKEINSFKGIITEIKLSNSSGSHGELIFSGYSPTILFENGENIKAYSNSNIKKIVSEILSTIPGNLMNVSNNPKNSSQIPYIVQYNESTFSFLKRIAYQFGEWFYYDGSNLIFGTPKDGKTYDLTYLRDSDYIQISMNVSNLKFTNYQYDYINKKILSSNSKSSVTGLDQLGKFASSEADKIYPNSTMQQNLRPVASASELDADVKAEVALRAADFVKIDAETDIPFLKLGSFVSVGLNDDDAGNFRVIDISHSTDGLGNYTNEIIGVPDKLEIPPLSEKDIFFPECDSQPALVVDNKDPEALGRIKVKFFWQTDSEPSPWLRMLQPHSGKEKGFYFIPEIDEEVMVAFENGNPDFPYIIGASFNGKEKPDASWKNDNNYLKAIKTVSGNVILFNDESGKEEVKIMNKDGQNEISLTLAQDGLITIKAKKKIILDSENIEIKCKDLKIDSQDKIAVTTKETTIKSQQKLVIETMTAEVKGTQAVKVEGAQIEIKGTAETKVSGAKIGVEASAMLELKAGAMAKMQAGVIMLN